MSNGSNGPVTNTAAATDKENASKKKRERIPFSYNVAVIVTLLVCAISVMLCLAPPNRAIKAGDIAKSTIIAPIDIEDTMATEAARADAQSKVEPVFYDDAQVFETLQQGALSFIDSLDYLRADGESLRAQKVNSVPEDSPLKLLASGSLTVEQWQLLLEGEGIEMLLTSYGNSLTETQIYNLLAISEMQLSIWLRDMNAEINSYLRQGINEGAEAERRKAFISEVSTSTPIAVRSVATTIANKFIHPTRFYDQSATERAIALSRRNVQPVYIAQGETVVSQGETITTYQYALLKQAGYTQEVKDIIIRCVMVALFFATVAIIMIGFSSKLFPGLLLSPVKSILTCILIILSLAVFFGSSFIHKNLSTAYLGAMLITQLIGVNTAVAATLFLAPVFGIIAGGTIVFDYFMIVQTLLATIVGSFAAIYIIRNATSRMNLLLGGFVCGMGMSIVYALFGTMNNIPVTDVLISCVWSICGGVVSAVLGIGLLPLWEMVFDIATPARLLELSNANHPLLKRLMLEAPGTYHHSMLVATLAEGCASAIGANSTLSRVGAYFHDIGKLKRPLYFAENQSSGKNPHDALDAQTSCAIITAHVKDGVTFARQNKLPIAVRNIIAQHHGTTIVAVFYYKALQEADADLSSSAFRYPGPKPQSKESAIVMLCDCVEAAVRSIEDQTYESVTAMINKVIYGKVEDAQLGNSPLALCELETIKQSMLQTFNGILHERVVYPDIDALKEELNDRN